MEKQRVKSISKSCRRLLAVLFTSALFTSTLFSQNISGSEINQLRIKASDNQSLFTKTDIKFEVTIPKVKPSQIQIQSPSLPKDVEARTIRKQEDFETSGTKIEMWFYFENKGTYQLPALPVIIQNRRRNISFSQIIITDDPSKQSPQMVIKFSNGISIASNTETKQNHIFETKVGEKQTLTVYVQYISQLVSLNWEIPKDSIFTQTKTYDITEIRYREKNYTHDLIPVAIFEWTGLKIGAQPMVRIKASVTDYNGYRNDLYSPDCYVDFTEHNSVVSNTDNQMFDEAFFQTQNSNISINKNDITREDCIKLAELYSEERNTILHFKESHKKRTDFENSIGIPSTSEGDFTIGLLHIAGAVCVVIFILLLIFIKRRRIFLILVFSVFFICSLIPMVSLFIKRNDTYGICTGCSIHSVPEEKAEAVSEIGPGNRVHITETAGRWIYIEFGESGGWGLKDSVIFIK